MSHEPECWMADPAWAPCICDPVRAAYQRGYAAGLDAARDAVAALPISGKADEWLRRADALAAIDALRGPETWQAKANRESVAGNELDKEP